MLESPSAEAVLFFEDHAIVKEMTYSEFQAILDNYVPLHDIAARQMKAVYVRVDATLCVTSAVFFRVAFDRQGFIEKAWNIPLQQLADNAAKGPNLGSGPIALACYSQCPVDWQRNSLWDPAMEASKNDFVAIKKTIKNNSLGLVFNKRHQANNGFEDDHYAEERTRAALLIKEQRLRHKLLSTKAQQDMRQLSLDHQERLLAYQQQLTDYQQQLNDQRALNLELHESLATQTSKMEGIRDYYESKLQAVQDNYDSEQLEAVREHYESEARHKVEAAVSDYEAELNKRDVELIYRSERETKLNEEIIALQQENQRLLDNGGEPVLEQLQESGVNFVIYHPGAGHLSLHAKDISEYLENTTAYVAKQCGVNEHLYRTWLDHFYNPTCQHVLDNGELCDHPVPRLDDPSQFIIGESDRCPLHQSQTPSVVSISKNGRQTANYSINKTTS